MPLKLIAFEELAPGAALAMLSPDDSMPREQKIVIVASGPKPAASETDIAGAPMIEYRFVAVRHVAAGAPAHVGRVERSGAAAAF